MLENPDIKVIKLDSSNGVLEIFIEDATVKKQLKKVKPTNFLSLKENLWA